MVNIHFSVLTNFVMLVYLDFSFQLNFDSIKISHFFKFLLCLIAIALTSHFKGHMKISASKLYHKGHYPESHSISNDIGIAKIPFFSYKISISHTSQYSFFCLVIRYQYHFDTVNHFSTISYPSIQRHPLVI